MSQQGPSTAGSPDEPGHPTNHPCPGHAAGSRGARRAPADGAGVGGPLDLPQRHAAHAAEADGPDCHVTTTSVPHDHGTSAAQPDGPHGAGTRGASRYGAGRPPRPPGHIIERPGQVPVQRVHTCHVAHRRMHLPGRAAAPGQPPTESHTHRNGQADRSTQSAPYVQRRKRPRTTSPTQYHPESAEPPSRMDPGQSRETSPPSPPLSPWRVRY